MSFPVRAITLDLDDTLWPFAPIGARIEAVLDGWLRTHAPETARRFPAEALRTLRERLGDEHPHLAHDMGAMRRMTLERAFADSGDDAALVDTAYAVFYAARNEVECYPDSLEALARIAARVPVAAVTNGNADLQRIGLDHHFRFSLGPGEHGAAKPDASIFLAACARLACAPGEVLHVGDHIEMDVVGAARAGLRSCWINRRDETWPEALPPPELEFATLSALADWLDAHDIPEPR
ncbi:MAG TPA: HAD-IA family hydrolase [Luteimonas sp.]|nr:HAD-IA family hydrolase [Luteimonas sp.]